MGENQGGQLLLGEEAEQDRGRDDCHRLWSPVSLGDGSPAEERTLVPR